jgi:hypothetical protein
LTFSVEPVAGILPGQPKPERIELQRAVMARLVDILDQEGAVARCRRSLENAVGAAIDLGLAAVVSPPPDDQKIPAAMLSHARAAARAGVPLEQVLRAYASGYSVFIEHVLCSAEGGPSAAAPSGVLRSLTIQFDRAVNAVVSEYNEAVPGNDGLAPTFQARLIEKLLRGEHVDSTALPYDFGGWHIALMLEKGKEAAEALRTIARRADTRLLIAELNEETVTGWLGSSDRKILDELPRRAQAGLRDLTVAVGEPNGGFAGWQFTYRQVESIWPYVKHSPPGVYRYAETGLMAAIAFNPVLARSMRGLYVEPLGPTSEVETVRAYLACGRNVSSAASRLGLSRQTVSSRLRAAEGRLGRSLDQCGAEVEIALRLDRLAVGVEGSPANL